MSKRTNEQWLADLQNEGETFETAVNDLRQILVRGLQRGLLNRVNTSAPEFDTQVEDFAQEAVLKILDKMHTFAGRSKFTTWAHKVAVSIALTELRRKRWQDQSLDKLTETEDGNVFTPSFLADPAPNPEDKTERTELLRKVNTVIQEGLTDKQRQVITLSILQGTSTPEVARRMDMKPNAVYKLLHDARAKLRRALIDNTGLTPQDVLATFSEN